MRDLFTEELTPSSWDLFLFYRTKYLGKRRRIKEGVRAAEECLELSGMTRGSHSRSSVMSPPLLLSPSVVPSSFRPLLCLHPFALCHVSTLSSFTLCDVSTH